MESQGSRQKGWGGASRGWGLTVAPFLHMLGPHEKEGTYQAAPWALGISCWASGARPSTAEYPLP